MKDEHAPVHQLDHAEPTVIHHPDQDMTILGRWLQQGMAQGPKFWLLAVVGAVLVLGLAALTSGLAAGKSAGAEAWSELTRAKTVEDRLKIAEAHPGTPAAGWAKLLAAKVEYSDGVDDLTAPGKKELAGPRLKKALELFQQVAKDAGKDSSLALGGLFGAARTLEARNELPEAIAQYKLVAERFPDSAEGKQSLAMSKALEEPVNQMFYKELYSYKAPATPPALPGSGLEGFGGSNTFLNPPANFGLGQPSKPSTPDMAPPAGLDAPPPPTAPSPAVEPPKAEAVPKKDETPSPAQPEAPKPEAPAGSPTPPK